MAGWRQRTVAFDIYIGTLISFFNCPYSFSDRFFGEKIIPKSALSDLRAELYRSLTYQLI
jgi:hypothetical protein